MHDDEREIHSILLYFNSGTEQEFHAKYSKAKLERGADWLPLYKTNWARMQDERVYRGTVLISTTVIWEPGEDAPEWEREAQQEEKEAVYIFSWSDVEAIRIIYQS